MRTRVVALAAAAVLTLGAGTALAGQSTPTTQPSPMQAMHDQMAAQMPAGMQGQMPAGMAERCQAMHDQMGGQMGSMMTGQMGSMMSGQMGSMMGGSR